MQIVHNNLHKLRKLVQGHSDLYYSVSDDSLEVALELNVANEVHCRVRRLSRVRLQLRQLLLLAHVEDKPVASRRVTGVGSQVNQLAPATHCECALR